MSTENDPSPYPDAQDDYIAATHLPYVSSPALPPVDVPAEQTQSQTIPTERGLNEIDQLAINYGLGHIQKALKNEIGKSLTGGVASLLIGLVCFLPIILTTLNTGGSFALSLRWTFLMGIAFLSYGINRSTFAIKLFMANTSRTNGHYYLCRYGLLRIKGKQSEGLRWDQVNAIQKILDIDGYTIHQYILYSIENLEPFVVDTIGNTFKSIGLQIEDGVSPHLLLRNRTAFKTGQTLDFGVVTLTSQGVGLREEERELPWEKVGIMEIQKDLLLIKQKQTLETWAEIDTSSLLNLCVLLPLVKEIQNNDLTQDSQKSLSYQPSQSKLSPSSEWQEYE